ncbi:MAG: HpcH/HpaI aldolase/citrate lyase family protein, partial [Hyphomonas sp.]
SLSLFAAHAANVLAIETIYPNIKDASGLREYALRARRDGFTGMMAIHPAQTDIINQAFAYSVDEIERAKRIVAAFNNTQSIQGAVQLDGKMLDAPHLKQARRILASIDAQ